MPRKIPGLRMTAVGEHGFDTPTGKFELYSTVIEGLNVPGLNPLPAYRPSEDQGDRSDYPLILSTGIRIPGGLHSRLHDTPAARSLRKEAMADMSAEDAARLGVGKGDRLRITTSSGSVTVSANPTVTIPAGMVSLYHGYREADANSLLSWDHRDPYSGFPGYRCIRCRVEKEA